MWNFTSKSQDLSQMTLGKIYITGGVNGVCPWDIMVVGAVLGTAEPGAGDQVGVVTAAGPEQLSEEPGAHLGGLHQHPAEASGDPIGGQV